MTTGPTTSGPTHEQMAARIWSVADLLRGDYRRHEYGHVILPFTVLRRLDAVMTPTRQAVRDRDAALPDIENKRILLERAAKLSFYNTSKLDFHSIAGDPGHVARNLNDYMAGFSPNVKLITRQVRTALTRSTDGTRPAAVQGGQQVRRDA